MASGDWGRQPGEQITSGQKGGCGLGIAVGVIFLMFMAAAGGAVPTTSTTNQSYEVNLFSKNHTEIGSRNDFMSENKAEYAPQNDVGNTQTYAPRTENTITMRDPVRFEWSNNVDYCPPPNWGQMSETERQGWGEWLRGLTFGDQVQHMKTADGCKSGTP